MLLLLMFLGNYSEVKSDFDAKVPRILFNHVSRFVNWKKNTYIINFFVTILIHNIDSERTQFQPSNLLTPSMCSNLVDACKCH